MSYLVVLPNFSDKHLILKRRIKNTKHGVAKRQDEWRRSRDIQAGKQVGKIKQTCISGYDVRNVYCLDDSGTRGDYVK